MTEFTKCYHQSKRFYNEAENEETEEILCADYEVCIECNMVIFNGEEMGHIK